jgi:hypothetical protein
MEPGGSLPSSQESSTGPYLEPDESSSYRPNISLEFINLDKNDFYAYKMKGKVKVVPALN